MMDKMKELVDVLNRHSYNYYVLDNPTISDKEYDKLYDELKALENNAGYVLSDSPTRRVGGEVLSGFKKHKHITKLYSLDKAQKYVELEAFLNKFDGEKFTVEPKFDGLTISITYENGEFVRATTRGDGTVGEDVTAQVLTIKTYPLRISYTGKIEVIGEGLIFLSTLKQYNETASEPLKNARNAVAGAIRNLDPRLTAQRKPRIIFYGINYADDENLVSSQDEVYGFLKNNGFLVSPIYSLCQNTSEVISAVRDIEDKRDELDFLIDGAVIKLNDRSKYEEIGYTEKFPKFSIAFKFEAEETSTILKDVIWQVGRTGKLTPLAVLESVELCGVTVSRATLNNYGDVQRKRIKIGDRVFVRRSNDVIPEVLGSAETFENSKEVEKPVKCPECGESLIEVGANLFCPNSDGCIPQIVGKITQYASKGGADIVGFSEMTARQLYLELKVKEPYELYEISKDRLLALNGFKGKKAENLINAINKSKKIELAKFIYSLGIPNVGVKTAKDLSNEFKTFDALRNASFETLCEIDEIGEIIAKSIKDYFLDEMNVKTLEKLLNYVTIINKTKSGSGVLQDEKFVLTGSLQTYKRSEAAKLIEENCGEVMSSVSKETTTVLAGENAGSKLEKAQKLGIKIIDEEEFKKLLGL